MAVMRAALYEVMTTTETTLYTIRLEIERATERRAELLHVLAEGHDAAAAAEHAEVEERIARLWDEYRQARVRGRFGDRDVIIKRARLEERLERRLDESTRRLHTGGAWCVNSAGCGRRAGQCP